MSYRKKPKPSPLEGKWMIVRDITEEDKAEIARWFERRKWPLPAKPNILPKIGAVAVSDKQLIACAWLYQTGTSLAFIEWTGTNPDVGEKIGMMGLTMVINKLKESCEHAKPQKIMALCHHVQNDKLADHYEKLGFKKKTKFSQMLWTQKNKG
jgi:hypothetical protein